MAKVMCEFERQEHIGQCGHGGYSGRAEKRVESGRAVMREEMRGGRANEEDNKRGKIERERKGGGYFGLNGEFIYKRSAFRSIRRS